MATYNITALSNQVLMLSANCKTIAGYHVVFKAQDAVVNIKLCQFFFVDADLMLFLDLHYPCLHLLPCGIGEFWLQGKKKIYTTITHNNLALKK